MHHKHQGTQQIGQGKKNVEKFKFGFGSKTRLQALRFSQSCVQSIV